MGKPVGIIKLVGIAGFVEGDEHTLKPGERVTLGRSRSCDISLRNSEKYLTVDPLQTQVDENFKTVSRTHVVLSYEGSDAFKVEDKSANGTFVDGKRLVDSCVIKNLATKSHEIKLGTNEAYRVEFHKLVKRKKTEIVKVADGEDPPAGAVPYDPEEEVEDIEEIEEIVEDIDDIEEIDDDDEDEEKAPLSDQVMESYRATHSKGPGKDGGIVGKRPGRKGKLEKAGKGKGKSKGSKGSGSKIKAAGSKKKAPTARLNRRLGRMGKKK